MKPPQRSLRLAILVFCLVTFILGAPGDSTRWHWASQTFQDAGDTVQFRADFDRGLGSAPQFLEAVGDFCSLEVFLNDQLLGRIEPYGPPAQWSLNGYLKPGANVVSIQATAIEGPSAFFLRLRLADGDVMNLSNWKYAANQAHQEVVWLPAENRGLVSSPVWEKLGREVEISPLDNYEQWKQALDVAEGTGVEGFTLQPGFVLDRIRSAGPDEDSWISMCFDQRGRIIIAREQAGLLRVTLGEKPGSPSSIEVINADIPEIRGVVWAHGALYVNSNSHNLRPRGKDESTRDPVSGRVWPHQSVGGLYRLRDSNGDEQFDQVELLGETTITGGHGRNDLALGPDGRIYLIAGDSVSVPKQVTELTPKIAPFLPGDDRDHGHVVRTDKDGRNWELVCKGLRNPFGIDFNEAGEMFTYDADAEHDMGSAWYRPTHLRQLSPGADYHWRRVTREWPPYYCDHPGNPPTTHVIGKGSPTAVKFGTHSDFPTRWREALYILDWAYGRIVAVHMEPQGAGYACRTEEFLRGRPANLTDLDFGPDGAMYFVTGGRKTQSALYRVRYVGPKESRIERGMQTLAREQFSNRQRTEHRRMFALGRSRDPRAAGILADNLASQDPWIRYSARLGLQNFGREGIREAIRRTKSVSAWLALAEAGTDEDLRQVAEWVPQVEFDKLASRDLPSALRICDILLRRGAEFDRLAIRKRLDKLFPTRDRATDRQLAGLLVTLQSNEIVHEVIDVLAATEDQGDRFHYLHVLRDARAGWDTSSREQYFRALDEAEDFRGGAGMKEFLQQIREDALGGVPEDERARFRRRPANRVEPMVDQALLASVAQRPLVREWSLNDLEGLARGQGDPRNGRRMFYAAMCVHCHSFRGEGRPLGPDLSDVSRRFNQRDLLVSILDPSAVIPEKYQSVDIRTKDGEEHSGLIAMAGDYRSPELRLVVNPLAGEAEVRIRKQDIVEQRVSNVSVMPAGLLNTLNQEEILDLLAFLQKGVD